MIQLETERLMIYPLSDKEMEQKISEETNKELRIAYGEMLDGCRKNPAQRVWSTIWAIQQKSAGKKVVGDLSFKGFNQGNIEIGYGILPQYERQGFMTEAVDAIIQWAAKQPGVIRIEAETEADNIASQKVLQKTGFVESGVNGEEGPRYVYAHLK